MSLSSQKAGTIFGKTSTSKSATLTPEEWAAIMLAAGFPTVPKVIAEGLGVIEAESGFRTDPGGDGAHFGAWQEDSSFGSEADRLDPLKATKGAKKRWEADGKSFQPAWTHWQMEQSHIDGAANGRKKYLKLATSVVGKWKNTVPGAGGRTGLSGEIAGGAEAVAGAITDPLDFLTELASTILDFRKLGQLAAEAVAWFLRLLAKAIWDYVMAPLWHWAERAQGFYWSNYFGSGTERGSGIGYTLRQNAGIITIGFWALGYAVLWTDGESLSPSSSHESMLGRGVKGIEGAVARRNLVKPDRVNEETPDKPKSKSSTIQIEKVKELSVSRKRPVTVTGPGAEATTGRTQNERHSNRVRRPGTEAQEKKKDNGESKIILPRGVSADKKAEAKKATKAKAAPDGKTGMGTRVDSGDSA